MTMTDRIIDAKELKQHVPYCQVHLRKLEGEGKFPKRIRLGQHRVGWSEREIDEWIEERKAERHNDDLGAA
jgi:prophage regulatory protein